MTLLISLASLLLWTAGLDAQIATDPSGHWEGTISAQFGTVRIELDLSKNGNGESTGTFSVPDRKLSGLPLVTLTIDGRSIGFEPVAIGARFHGDIAADGKEISGLFENTAGSIPVTLTRTGDARLFTAPKNVAFAKEFEGTWNGTLDVDGGKRVLLKMANLPDNTATGTVISVDEGGLEMPAAITQNGVNLKLELSTVSGVFAGRLSEDQQELVGTFTTAQGLEIPLTLRRGAGVDAKK